MKRKGGTPEVMPVLILWIWHKLVGHPAKDIKNSGIYMRYCDSCGAVRL